MPKTDIVASFEELKREVAETRDYVLNNLITGTKEEELYKGTAILYSGLIYNPTFLFIGINPGQGFYKLKGIKYRETELNPLDDFEYTDEECPDYSLAEQTRTAFEKTKYKDSLSKSVKTNLFYTSTSGLKQMHELFDILDEKFGVNYYEKSLEWTKRLISLIEPKIIICEGKLVVDILSKYYEVEPNWNQETAAFQIDGEIRVLGYKRRYSHIRNIDSFVMALNSL